MKDKLLQSIFYVLNLPLLPVGKTTVTLAMLFYIIILFALLVRISRSIRKRVLDRVLEKSRLDAEMKHFFAMFIQYSFVGIGSVIILNTAGIEMTALTVVAGAMGLGLSLGMQTIAKSVAGGVMILLERPIKVGDRIQIGSTTGEVTRIALRSTTIRSDEHIEIIIPNADFMEQRVSNWTLSSRSLILNLPLSVSAENDLSQVKELILDSARANKRVLTDPAPEVLLDSFEAGKLKLFLRAATENLENAGQSLKSELNCQILQRFREAQVKLDS